VSTTWLLDQLPSYLASDDFFARFVAMFAELAEGTLAHADALPHLADVDVTPDAMVPFLASWMGVGTVDDTLPGDRQRLLVARLGAIQAWRGTRRGLCDVLELVTGAPATVVDSGGIYAEGEAPRGQRHVVVRVETAGSVTREHLFAFVSDEVPTDCSFELEIGDDDASVTTPRRRRRA
jgi:phage tail-like protein